jgi:hypothetical protein
LESAVRTGRGFDATAVDVGGAGRLFALIAVCEPG